MVEPDYKTAQSEMPKQWVNEPALDYLRRVITWHETYKDAIIEALNLASQRGSFVEEGLNSSNKKVISTSVIRRHPSTKELITLSNCTDGWWLWDHSRGMNLAMKEESERQSFISAIGYYQDRLTKVEREYNDMAQKVEHFVEQFKEKDED